MMQFQTEIPFERLAQRLAPGSRLRRVWPLTGGISAEMAALEIEHPDGDIRRLIVRRPGASALRRNPQAARDEFRLLQITWSLGLATPAPYHLDESDEIFPTPYFVIEYVAGKPDFAPADLTQYIYQFAAHLAAIHGIDGSRPELSHLPQRAPECTETFAKPLVGQALDTQRIQDRLAALGPLPQRNAPALLHGDYWPGNLLWREGRLAAVIDWEDAARGDPLMDLAISRLDMLCIFGVDALNAFTHHYQAMTALDFANLPYWDLCAALRLARLIGSDLAGWAAFYPPFGREDITEQTIREHYDYFVAQALEAPAA